MHLEHTMIHRSTIFLIGLVTIALLNGVRSQVLFTRKKLAKIDKSAFKDKIEKGKLNKKATKKLEKTAGAINAQKTKLPKVTVDYSLDQLEEAAKKVKAARDVFRQKLKKDKATKAPTQIARKRTSKAPVATKAPASSKSSSESDSKRSATTAPGAVRRRERGRSRILY